MRVGWLHDDLGYLGGAELTMQEFAAAAPKDVEIVKCPPGKVEQGLDRYVVGNCMTYGFQEFDAALTLKSSFRYHHDINRSGADRGFTGRHIFCSWPQQQRMNLAGACIPPAIDLKPFETLPAAVNLNGHTGAGAVCIGRMAYGKGLELLAEFPEPVDVYSSVPIESWRNVTYKGEAKDVPATLAKYERFVFLPTAFEPFGRAVVEAWAAGLELVINNNVGARYWIEEAPDKLRTAGGDFWEYVLS